MTEQLKKIYCEDNGIAVGIFEEPIFSDRIRLFGHEVKFYNFRALIDRIGEEAYFRVYKEAKNKAIEFIQSTSTFEALKNLSAKDYEVRDDVRNMPRSDIYNKHNVGSTFISIDMIKGNFNTYVTFSKMLDEPVRFNDGSYDYEKFISQFTDVNYIINSREFRQNIFGQCAPSSIAKIERYLTRTFLAKLIDKGYFNIEDVMTVHDDEIVIKVNDDIRAKLEILKAEIRASEIPFSYQMYDIWRIKGSKGYIKHITDGKNAGTDELKCAYKIEQPAIYRFLANERGDCSDLMYIEPNTGKKAMLVEKLSFSIEKSAVDKNKTTIKK